MSRKGILLLNLGSPKSTSVPDVRNYLREFLNDDRVIDYPAPLRWILLEGIILRTRPKKSAAAYASVWTPEGSPLVVTTDKLRAKLEKATGLPVIMGMRYGTPSCAEAVEKVIAAGIDDLFVMPQYPHYAMSSYETVVVKVQEELKRLAPGLKYHVLQPFYNDPAYIDALVESAQPWLSKPFDKLLFSYHGLPERHLRKGDPSKAHCMKMKDCCSHYSPCQATCYRHQCVEMTRLFVAAAGLKESQYELSFQSRLAGEKWVSPYTDKRLEALPEEGTKNLLVMCPAFTSDCLETLEEIREEGKETFIHAGGEHFEQIPCLNDSDIYVKYLVNRVNHWKPDHR
ncbi:MAG: ferrochelatase [Verrucomicrobia bacterium]|nr:ferrochelatase [Verrucomicrobiota bacterium]